MKRQRSKAELLLHMRTYQALKKDAENKESISGKTVYWRMAVEWCTALWKEEKFSTNELAKFLQYIADNNVTELTEERREEIRNMLLEKVDWVLNNPDVQQRKKNAVDQAVSDFQYYNTEGFVNYSLLACEYLVTQKGFGKKRLDRVMGNVDFFDNLKACLIWDMRQELFDQKGIWVELGKDDIPEDAKII